MPDMKTVTIGYEGWCSDGEDYRTHIGLHRTENGAHRSALAFVIEQLERWDRDMLLKHGFGDLVAAMPIYDAAKRSRAEAMAMVTDMAVFDNLVDVSECSVDISPVEIDADHFNQVVRENEGHLDDSTFIEILAKRKAATS
jgi:hypothetical protein